MNKPKQYGKKLDLIVKLLTIRLNKKKMALFLQLLKEVQEIHELSYDYIRYLVLSSQIKNAEKYIHTREGIDATQKYIDKIRMILKRKGIKIESRAVTYYSWKDDTDLFKIRRQRLSCFFKV